MVFRAAHRWWALLVLLLFLRQPLGAATYRIATTPWMGWAFLDVAEAKGFWSRQGVAVELVNFPDGTSYLDALLAGMVDFSCAMVGDAVWIHTHRAPVRILLETDWSLGGDKFFIRRGHTLASLKGHPIGYYQARYALPYFLKRTLGAEFSHVQASPSAVFTPPDLVAQFNAGRLDQGVICDPYAQQLDSQAIILATSATRPGSLPECFLCFRAVFERTPEKDMRALVRGILAATAWMHDPGNATELLGIVQSRSFRGASLGDPADLARQMQRAPAHPPALLRRRNSPGGGLEQFLAGCQGFLAQSDPQNSHFRPRDLFDSGWTARVLKENR